MIVQALILGQSCIQAACVCPKEKRLIITRLSPVAAAKYGFLVIKWAGLYVCVNPDICGVLHHSRFNKIELHIAILHSAVFL